MSIFKDGAYFPLGCAEEMSEGEYQEQLGLCEDLARPEPLLDGVGHGNWRVRGGAVLKIREMSDRHLQNAIGFFERRGAGDHDKICELRDELGRRNR